MLNYLEMSSEHLEYMSCGMVCIFWSVSKFNMWSLQAWESLVHSSVQGSFQAVHSLLSCCVNKTLEVQSKIKKINDARQTGEEQKWSAKRMNG